MSRFAGASEFVSRADMKLLPFRFERLENGRFLVGNMAGDMLNLEEAELNRLAVLNIAPGDGLYERAAEKLLFMRSGQQSALQLLAMRIRSRLDFLRATTPLHIFVVTLRCEHSCPYCQVSRRSVDRGRFDMDMPTALAGLEVALQAPSPAIKFEFQGGEPLLNFELIKEFVPIAAEAATRKGKKHGFVITTNLALLSDEVLDFCKRHDVLLSTSLDGPEDLHNQNRPRPGRDSHQLAVAGIRRAQEVLGKDRVGALMTTTVGSLSRVKEIVDEYLVHNLDGIFLRPLSPYGFAVKTKQINKYDRSAWLEFYKEGLEYVLQINKSGRYFPEFYTALLLKRLLSDRPTTFVDLRSPAGIGLGALVYNYDGKVYASDEARMLAETGDHTFQLGVLGQDDYQSLISSDQMIGFISDSLTQSAPQCASCVFEPHCGADPVYHHATQGDVVGMKPLSDFCTRQKGMLAHILHLLETSPTDAAILRGWVN